MASRSDSFGGQGFSLIGEKRGTRVGDCVKVVAGVWDWIGSWARGFELVGTPCQSNEARAQGCDSIKGPAVGNREEGAGNFIPLLILLKVAC